MSHGDISIWGIIMIICQATGVSQNCGIRVALPEVPPVPQEATHSPPLYAPAALFNEECFIFVAGLFPPDCLAAGAVPHRQGCIGREEASEAAPEAVRQAVGGGCQAVGGGYCRLQMPLKLPLGVRGTVAGHRMGPLERGGASNALPIGIHRKERHATQA